MRERGPWPVNALHPHVLISGTSLACSCCGTEGRAPLSSVAVYNQYIKTFYATHRLCARASS